MLNTNTLNDTGQPLASLKLKYALAGLAFNREVLYGWTDGPKYWIYAFEIRAGTYCKFKGMCLFSLFFALPVCVCNIARACLPVVLIAFI